MNAIEIANNLFKRIKLLKKFEVVRTVPENFRFTGRVPFDISIYGDQMYIEVYATNLDEASSTVDNWLES